ncbi:MAG: aldehyde dehydrogenase family protein [Proteobacteria bacterium]|nr:MAG: aldehyde dehydrogenase family protein [Pseudomonadota bacterium]
MSNSSRLNNLPFPEVPEIRGRLLIAGRIESEGFEKKKVYSNSFLPNSKRNEQGATYLGDTPHIDSAKFMEAVEAAQAAWSQGQGAWPTARMEERVLAVQAFRDRMLEQREIIARLLMWEIGKNWADAQGEFDRTIQYINDTMDEVKKLDRESTRFQFAGGVMAQIRRAPLGVTLCMGPFNYPLNETFTTLIPALIMGNTVVVKVSRYGELFWDCLLEAFRDSFPAGVANIINGRGREIVAGAVRSGKIDVLAFIGSSRVANQIKLEHPQPHRFRSILALEAKNPAIILEDADLDIAVAECLKGTLSFNGQRCTALKMVLVHKSKAAEFTKRFTEKVEALPRGMPWDPKSQITPLPDNGKPGYLNELIEEAVKLGARVNNPDRGGKTEGTLYHPAVVTNVPLAARLAQEEQFGPVIPIREFSTLQEVEDYIVQSPYGSQASIFGQDPQAVGHLIDRISNQVCRINLNSQCQRGPDVFPFTGRKDSAEGTLSVYDALRSFSIRTMVAAKQDGNGKGIMRGILQQDSSRFLSSDIVL